MNSHWLRAEREMSQIGRGSLNFKLAIREMNFSRNPVAIEQSSSPQAGIHSRPKMQLLIKYL